MIDRIGSLLTPLLLITILAMIIKGFVDFGGQTPDAGNTKLFHSAFGSFSRLYSGILNNGCNSFNCVFNDCR